MLGQLVEGLASAPSADATSLDPIYHLLGRAPPAPPRAAVPRGKYDMVGQFFDALPVAPSSEPASLDPLAHLFQTVASMHPAGADAASSRSAAKYDMLGQLLEGLAAGPPPSEPAAFDPVHLLLKGGPKAAGDAPPTLGPQARFNVLGRFLERLAAPPKPAPEEFSLIRMLLKAQQRAAEGKRDKRSRKYDMLGQVADGMASLPRSLSSGRWAAQQGTVFR